MALPVYLRSPKHITCLWLGALVQAPPLHGADFSLPLCLLSPSDSSRLKSMVTSSRKPALIPYMSSKLLSLHAHLCKGTNYLCYSLLAPQAGSMLL